MIRARTPLDRIPMPGPITFAALLGVCLVLFLSVGTILIVYGHANFSSGFRTSDWAALNFTVFQAALSAFLSVLFAIPVARALARQHFWGRSVFITLLGAPFILPVIVAILGLLAVFGNAGTLISFRVGAEDAGYLAKEFEPKFSRLDLINLANTHIYLKLMINGAPSKPFSAITLTHNDVEREARAKALFRI